MAVYKILLAALALIRAGDVPTPFRILQMESGPDTKIVGARAELVQDARRWRQVWADHREVVLDSPGAPVLDVPPVDFSKHTVLVLAPGLRQGVEGYRFLDADETREMVRIRFAPVFSAGSVFNAGSSPYVFAVLPRMNRRLEVHMDLRSSPRQDAVWTRVGAFEKTLESRG
jgi:hypothetical protein